MLIESNATIIQTFESFFTAFALEAFVEKNNLNQLKTKLKTETHKIWTLQNMTLCRPHLSILQTVFLWYSKLKSSFRLSIQRKIQIFGECFCFLCI